MKSIKVVSFPRRKREPENHQTNVEENDSFFDRVFESESSSESTSTKSESKEENNVYNIIGQDSGDSTTESENVDPEIDQTHLDSIENVTIEYENEEMIPVEIKEKKDAEGTDQLISHLDMLNYGCPHLYKSSFTTSICSKGVYVLGPGIKIHRFRYSEKLTREAWLIQRQKNMKLNLTSPGEPLFLYNITTDIDIARYLAILNVRWTKVNIGKLFVKGSVTESLSLLLTTTNKECNSFTLPDCITKELDRLFNYSNSPSIKKEIQYHIEDSREISNEEELQLCEQIVKEKWNVEDISCKSITEERTKHVLSRKGHLVIRISTNLKREASFKNIFEKVTLGVQFINNIPSSLQICGCSTGIITNLLVGGSYRETIHNLIRSGNNEKLEITFTNERSKKKLVKLGLSCPKKILIGLRFEITDPRNYLVYSAKKLEPYL